MTQKATCAVEIPALRRQAETFARKKVQQLPQDIGDLSLEEIHHLFHELQVHQIELEMQNENPKQAQAELEASHEEYFDLYDLAPVGYLTLTDLGLITKANVTAAEILGVTKDALVNRMLTSFIWPADVDLYYFFHNKWSREDMMNMREVKERAARMGVKAGKKTKTEMIRMIQKSEGNTPCFQTEAFSSCVEKDCCWRSDCSSSR